jgi:hypothetical protein
VSAIVSTYVSIPLNPSDDERGQKDTLTFLQNLIALLQLVRRRRRKMAGQGVCRGLMVSGFRSQAIVPCSLL